VCRASRRNSTPFVINTVFPSLCEEERTTTTIGRNDAEGAVHVAGCKARPSAPSSESWDQRGSLTARVRCDSAANVRVSPDLSDLSVGADSWIWGAVDGFCPTGARVSVLHFFYLEGTHTRGGGKTLVECEIATRQREPSMMALSAAGQRKCIPSSIRHGSKRRIWI
jgi:hypothetical protein